MEADQSQIYNFFIACIKQLILRLLVSKPNFSLLNLGIGNFDENHRLLKPLPLAYI